MAAITPRNHETDFHEHATQDVHPVVEPVATERPVNGDAPQHSTDNGYAQPPSAATELNNNELPTPKLQRSSPPHIETTVSEAAPVALAESTTESTPLVTQITETTTTFDDPTMPTTVTTIASEVPPPEAAAEQLMGSPEIKMHLDGPLSIPSNAAQAVISDERNDPFDHETDPTPEPPTDLQSRRAENGNVVVPVTEISQTSLPQVTIANSGTPPPTIVEKLEDVVQNSDTLAATAAAVSETPKLEDSLRVETSDTPTLPTTDTNMEDTKMEDVVSTSSKVAREREEDDEEMGPETKRTKTDIVAVEKEDPELGTIVEAQKTELETPVSTIQPPTGSTSNDVTMTTETTETKATTQDSNSAAVTVTAAGAPVDPIPSVDAEKPPQAEDWGPLTDYQARQLRQNTQNLKKGKHAVSFSKPVDAVALNIPTYYEIVKNPMDLSTMEQKLKDGKYTSVNEYITDFNLIVNNCVTFNGAQHVITLAAKNMEAHFNSLMKKVPKADEVVPPAQKKERKSSIVLPPRESKRRESRPSLGSAVSPTATGNPTFALGKDGVPLTRRTSTAQDGRPKREIHKPPPKELPYSVKPKKKKFQMELKFCEYVLSELKRGRYAPLMAPFAQPVDPVALNIPEYHKHVKKPMDFQTITDKLRNGQYENAREFEADVRLVFFNCVKFNGPTHAVTLQGKQLEGAFDDLWAGRQKWMHDNAPASAPQSPAAYSETEEEEEEEEDDDEDAEQQRAEQIANLQAKIAELSAQVHGLGATAPTKKVDKPKKKTDKPKKTSGVKQTKKSMTGSSATSKKQDKKSVSKSKPKASPKPITMKEKSEIAERIGELSTEDTTKAADYIKKGLKAIGSPLADRPDEELEFDIDVIPEETLHQLLKLVRKNDAPVKETRPAYTLPKSNTVSKPKKNKPMGKHEQEDAIRRLQNQMENFQNSDAAGGSDPTMGQADSSGDEDSGSESEEE